MKIYLAARYSRFPEMQIYAKELLVVGHTVTSRWIRGNHQISDEGLSTEAVHRERVRFAEEDCEDVMAADCVISFTEEPRAAPSRGGRHVELGVAIAMGKRLLVVGPRENIFHCLPQVEWHSEWGEAVRSLVDASETISFSEALRRCDAQGLLTEAQRAEWLAVEEAVAR